MGDFGDLPALHALGAAAGQAFVQILPITEVPARETSPYSALTAMALDPIYISLPAVEDFQALGGEARLDDDDRRTLAGCGASGRVEHQRIRPLKSRCLRRAFARFASSERGRDSDRATAASTRFVADEAWWLDDYALFQAHSRLARTSRAVVGVAGAAGAARTGGARRARATCSAPKSTTASTSSGWRPSSGRRRRAHSRPVQLFGDVPFMISADSPDVWTRQDEFRLDATVGVPPDAFSETGQDWGLPPWRWDVMAARRVRVDAAAGAPDRHPVRRLPSRPSGRLVPHLHPAARQPPARRSSVRPTRPRSSGWARLSSAIYQETGAEVIAEDLGTVPDFVRASLQRLDVPGFKVLRWERAGTRPVSRSSIPLDYPEASVATTGTHDTEPLATWWDLAVRGRSADRLQETPTLRQTSATAGSALDALLRALLAAPSRLAIIPVQDVFGWRDRINTPAQVDEHNWTWRLPWRVDELGDVAEACDRAEALAGWTRAAAAIARRRHAARCRPRPPLRRAGRRGSRPRSPVRPAAPAWPREC